eukprot:6265088-Pyramimonas_sp.AAC.1
MAMYSSAIATFSFSVAMASVHLQCLPLLLQWSPVEQDRVEPSRSRAVESNRSRGEYTYA